MKLRTLFVMAIGVIVGYLIANKLREDDPAIVSGPQATAANGNGSNPALRIVSSSAQRLADQASVRGLEAIRRARGAIQARVNGDIADDVDWG
jgi:hypothetical protein